MKRLTRLYKALILNEDYKIKYKFKVPKILININHSKSHKKLTN